MLPVRYLYNSEQNIGIRTMMVSNDNGNDNEHDGDKNDKMNVKMT